MKVLSIITKFSDYLSDFYRRHPQVKSQSYENQYKALANDAYGGFAVWSTGLEKLGYQSDRVFVNVPDLQRKWAQEHGIDFDPSNWIESMLKSQIAHYHPEIIIVSKQSTFSVGYIQSLKKEFPFLRLIVAWCCSPYTDPSVFREYDFILSCSPEMAKDFKDKGLCCYHLYHGFDERVLNRIDLARNPTINFSFVGSLVKATGYHNEREALLVDLVKATKLEIWSSVNIPTHQQRAKVLIKQVLYDLFHHINLLQGSIEMNRWVRKYLFMDKRPDVSNFVDKSIVGRIHPAIFGIPMYQKLRDSKLTLNSHGDIAGKSAANMRLFEATGVGTCLVTDWKENLKDLFQPDFEVVTYKSPAECIDKVQYLLQHDRDRREIAEAGQKRTLQNHSIYHRAERLDEIIRGHLRSI